MEQPAAVSISESASLKATSSRCARRRPRALLPAPIIPTSATVRISVAILPAYTSACISATNFFQCNRMRSRTLSRNREGLGWGIGIGLGILALVILGAAALAIYAGKITPPRHSVDQVVPN